jgi:hypothetical protein
MVFLLRKLPANLAYLHLQYPKPNGHKIVNNALFLFLKFTKIETYGKNLIKIGRFQMPQYIGCPMEKACLAYVKVSGIFPA